MADLRATGEGEGEGRRSRGKAEILFEKGLWATRFMTLLPIAFSLLGSLAMFVLGSVEVVETLGEAFAGLGGGPAEVGVDLQGRVVVGIIGAVDSYLIAIVLLIFSFGVYTLFISEIDEAKTSEASRILDIHSLDSLKDKLSQVIMMALIVKFFQMVFTMYRAFATPLDMIYLALSILGLGLALYFVHKAKSHPSKVS